MQTQNEKIMAAILAEMKDREHAEHSPSSLKFKALCGGFRQDNTGDKTAADRGTLGHKAVELENPDILPDDDEELHEAVVNCIDYLNAIREQYGQPHGEKKEFIIPEEEEPLKNETAETLLPMESTTENKDPEEKQPDLFELGKAAIKEDKTRYGYNEITKEEIEFF